MDSSGEMVGVLALNDAIAAAERQGLDLVEISPTAVPPVCKITDFGRYKYEQQKNAVKAKSKQKIVHVKEVKLRPNIAAGDFDVKLRNAMRFVKDGDKVKVVLSFRGREITHNEVGYEVMGRFREAMLEVGRVESDMKLEGKQIHMIIAPKLR